MRIIAILRYTAIQLINCGVNVKLLLVYELDA
jgi:hypothetical protein